VVSDPKSVTGRATESGVEAVATRSSPEAKVGNPGETLLAEGTAGDAE
jgi:hypothetical protein